MTAFFTPEAIREEWAKRNMKASSIRTMDYQLKRVFDCFGKDTYDIEVIRDAKVVWKTLKEKIDNPGIVKSLVQVSMNAMKSEKQDVSQYEKVFEKAIMNFKKKNEGRKEEVDKNFTWDKVMMVYRYLQEKMKKPVSHNIYLKYVIMSCYTLVSPLRAEQWCNAVIFPADGTKDERMDKYSEIFEKGFNVYNPNYKELVSAHHKTSKMRKIHYLQISDELHNILMEFNKFNQKINPTNALLIKSDGKTLNHANVYYHLTGLLGKKCGSSGLRKLYVSSHVGGMTPKKRVILAYNMNHTMATQELTYNRFVYEEIEEESDDEDSDE